MEKMTRKVALEIAINAIKAQMETGILTARYAGEDAEYDMQDAIESLSKMLEQVDRKPATAPTKTQTENNILAVALWSGMEPNRYYTVSELIAEIPECNGLSVPKVSALLRTMREAGKVKRVEYQRKASYCRVEA